MRSIENDWRREDGTALREAPGAHEEAAGAVRIRSARQNAVARVGLRALQASSLDEILSDAVTVLREILGVEYSEILAISSDGSLRFRCGSGWPRVLSGLEQIDACSASAPAFALRSGRPVVVCDFRSERRFGPSALERTHHVLSGITTVIHGRHAVFGVLGTHSRERRWYTQEDLLLQQSIANLISCAVQRHEAEAEREEALLRAAAAQEEAERASRAKSHFLGMLGHELRTPLSAMVGYLDLVESGLHGPVTEGQRRDLACIRRSQDYLLSLIENVLSFLKLDNGRVRYDIADVDVAGILASIDEMIRPLMRLHQLTYRQSAPPEDAVVAADAEKVQQILLNLLSNAAKFTAPGGQVTLDCALGDGTVDLYVRDTGVGIPADKLQEIFEPFVRVEGDCAKRVDGTGLGLAISREFADGMGARLSVESHLGKGSSFTLCLPRSRTSSFVASR